MPPRPKPEFPPLLQQGLHRVDLASLRALTVDRFTLSVTRARLWSNFQEVVDDLIRVQISCDIWIDGSYLTEKIDPEDVDFVVDIPVDMAISPSAEQWLILSDLSQQKFKSSHDLHSFVMFSAPPMHALGGNSIVQHQQWEKDFGFSFVGRVPKGIAVLEVR